MNNLQSDLSELFGIIKRDKFEISFISVGEKLYTYIKTFCHYQDKAQTKGDMIYGIPVKRDILFQENNFEVIYKDH